MAHPYFGMSVNPISTRGDILCPPNYYWHTRIFRPSDGPAKGRWVVEFLTQGYKISLIFSKKIMGFM